MSELVQMFGAMSLVISLFAAMIVRAGLRDIKEDRTNLTEAWADYYTKSQSYRPIKKFHVEYVDGTSEVVRGDSYRNDADGFTINDENGKSLLLVKAERVNAVRIERYAHKVDGPKTEEDR